MANENGLYSTVVKSGKNTYFVDVKEAKNGNKYLAITESQAGDPPKNQSEVPPIALRHAPFTTAGKCNRKFEGDDFSVIRVMSSCVPTMPMLSFMRIQDNTRTII